MPIINNNVQNVKFLRNKTPFESREAARQALVDNKGVAEDGTSLLARYSTEESGATVIKTIVGYVAEYNSIKHLTIIDVEGGSEDVEKLRQEINAKLGTTFISSGNTVEANLTALSGNGQSTSAETSVEGAKRYADELKNQMDYSCVTTGTGVYVTNVTQADGIVSATTAVLPSVTDTKAAKKVVVSVSEDKGLISIERGTISSSAETMVLTDNADGGVNFEVNIDGASIVQDPTSNKIKVADSALTQYFGDEKTIHAEVDAATNKKTFNTLLQISATTPSETNVKEQYNLVNASGETIGATIKIYKDSSLYNVYLGHIDDTIAGDPPVVTSGTGDTALCFIYHKEDGSYELVTVNVESFLEETEFESGVTATNHIVHGVVDPTSEKDSQDTPVDFLTVGEDGFKVGGIKDEIDRKINALDATGGTQTIATDKHVAVEVIEANGLITAVTVTEGNIADADDLATLSASTISGITSTGGSISVVSDNAAGNKSVNIETDADKIKMSGFTSVGALSGITPSSSITDAFGVVEDVIEENERITAGALTDLDGRLDVVEDKYISGVSVNGKAVTVADKVAPISITAATSAATATSTEAIVVNTDNSGNITLGIANIDCGYYDGTQG
jgi:hypothetical protein